MRVLLAPDKFRGSLTAAQVAAHLRVGLRAGRPEVEVTAVPIADGGEGTVAAAVAAGYRQVDIEVTGPTGDPVLTSFGMLADRAVVELADACGLSRLPGGIPAPMTASSAGLGEVLLAAVRAGARTVAIGIGGSAGTDGGSGMLSALGARILRADGRPVDPGGGGLAAVERLVLTGLDPALAQVQLLLAFDVENPLLGPAGAAAVYGPQKGATPRQVAALDRSLARWADVVEQAVAARSGLCRDDLPAGRLAEVPGAGAAGGVGFAALAVLGARPCPGIELVLGLTDFAGRLQDCDVVVTGEGSLDEQTLQGKGPAGVAAAAAAAGRPVIAVAGRVTLTPEQLTRAGFRRAYALLDIEPDLATCMAQAGPLLERLGRRLAADLQEMVAIEPDRV